MTLFSFHPYRRHFTAAFLALLSWTAAAQAFPSKPIKIIDAFAPGATTDILARTIAGPMSNTFGQPVVVESRTGANGVVGSEFVAKAAPDGYTMFVGSTSTLAVNQALHTEMERTFLTRTSQEWEDILNDAEVPAARARTIPEALAMAQVRERGIMHRMDVPGIEGSACFPLVPFMLSAGGAQVDTPPPLMGQDTDTVLTARGYDPQGIARLRAQGVV